MLAHGILVEFNAARSVDETVKDGVGHGGIANELMPAVWRELAGDEGGGAALAVIKDLQEVAVLVRGGFFKPPVINDRQLGLGQLLEQGRQVAACLACTDLPEQLWGVEVDLAASGRNSGPRPLKISYHAQIPDSTRL